MTRVIKFRAWDVKNKAWKKFYINDNLAVTQFTGLLDKHGKEIYEGDIVEFDKREWYRSYVLSLAEIDAKPPYYELVEFDYEYLAMRRTDFNQYCTVIGNIYENGDLLNDK